ncbi:hypothetical protein KOW79_000150 [Hemibagrus wyckioides]|uniref:Uncharacterized protein n=1 Tax=Hemibagrus wyckioides TaxID=337641 RepID=A0A9D3P6I3_9TELE|nr:hypothetical protein KOW79_000150 [Hemibagrus wyckioides]
METSDQNRKGVRTRAKRNARVEMDTLDESSISGTSALKRGDTGSIQATLLSSDSFSDSSDESSSDTMSDSSSKTSSSERNRKKNQMDRHMSGPKTRPQNSMDPAATETIRQMVSGQQGVLPALQEATATRPGAATVPTASQPAAAADSPTAACPLLNPEVTYLTGPMATPSSYSGSAEDCSGFLLQC